MAAPLSRPDLQFLFQTAEGRIDARTWWQGTGALAACLGVLTAIWLALEPYAYRDLASSDFLAPMTLVAYIYLLFYAFAVLLIAICHYNLSAKRWRDRGRPPALAGLLPFLTLMTGAAYWLQPRIADSMSFAYVLGIDVVLVAIIIWNIVELGFDRP